MEALKPQGFKELRQLAERREITSARAQKNKSVPRSGTPRLWILNFEFILWRPSFSGRTLGCGPKNEGSIPSGRPENFHDINVFCVVKIVWMESNVKGVGKTRVFL